MIHDVRFKYECLSRKISNFRYKNICVAYNLKGGVTEEKDYGEAKGEKAKRRVRWGFVSEEVIPAVHDCSAFEGSRTSRRLYMHDPEDGKASRTKLIPVVLVSNVEDLPSAFCRRAVSKAFERFLANHRYESGSELDNTNPRLKGNAIDLSNSLYISVCMRVCVCVCRCRYIYPLLYHRIVLTYRRV